MGCFVPTVCVGFMKNKKQKATKENMWLSVNEMKSCKKKSTQGVHMSNLVNFILDQQTFRSSYYVPGSVRPVHTKKEKNKVPL